MVAFGPPNTIGMYIKVKVFPGQKREELKMVSENRFEARVREPAERNLANKRIKELMASHFSVPTGKVRIVSGHQHSSKILSVEISEN